MTPRLDQSPVDALREPAAALDRVAAVRERERAAGRDAHRLRRATLKRICELGRLRCARAAVTVIQGTA